MTSQNQCLKKFWCNIIKKKTQKTYNTITKPCKKLIQKYSRKSFSDTICLCSLAYWLYIYEDKELALEICKITREVEFSFEFRGWNRCIQNIYGLEIRIARESLGENRRNNIPTNLLEYCFSKKLPSVNKGISLPTDFKRK